MTNKSVTPINVISSPIMIYAVTDDDFSLVG